MKCNLNRKHGAKDALEVMKWTREAIKTILQDISLVNKDGTIQRADIGIVNQMSNLFTYRRNNFPLPDWLQIYSPETIEQLGGVELLQQAIKVRGEELTKEAISILTDGFENDQKNNLRSGKKYVKPGEITPEEKKIS